MKIYSTDSPLQSNYFVKRNYLNNIRRENNELSVLQKYVIDFQQKSKLLLSQLEEKVLGKDGNNI